MATITPAVGSWYREAQQGLIFEVVAYDEAEDTVATQYVDGELDEFDMDSWQELALEEIEEPEDWRNAYELSDEDYDDPDEPFRPENWSGALADIESDYMAAVDDY